MTNEEKYIEQDTLDLWAEINKLSIQTQRMVNSLEVVTDLLKTLEKKINVLERDAKWRC
jgi:hypothetical protein